jgi:hypothetical protein
MRAPFRRRNRFEKAVKAARDAEIPSAVRSAASGIQLPKAVKSGATALVAATAASAAISAVRRRIDEGSGDQ